MVRKSSDVHVALLRGVNVGGKNKLPMKELAATFVAAGCDEVRTYIQSGNVVCRAAPTAGRTLAAELERAILKRFGLRVPVVLRTADELDAVVAENPFLAAGSDPALLHVAFLADLPGPDRIASLDPARSPPDELVVRGRDVYLRLPNGVGRTKLTNAHLDSKLGTTSTMRNWRTVLQLLELARPRA